MNAPPIRLQRMARQRTDSELLDYVALYVSQIATLPDDGKGGIRCEVIAEDTDENLNVCIVRRGKTLPDALRKALTVAMLSLPSVRVSDGADNH